MSFCADAQAVPDPPRTGAEHALELPAASLTDCRGATHVYNFLTALAETFQTGTTRDQAKVTERETEKRDTRAQFVSLCID